MQRFSRPFSLAWPVLLPLFAVALTFQNCGEIKISPPDQLSSTEPLLAVTENFKGRLCGHRQDATSVSTYNMSYFFIVNLTGIPQNGQFKIDSNINGIIDSEEGTIIPATVAVLDIDNDSDGIPDFLEISRGTNPGYIDANTDGIDNDGITNVVEIQTGLDPNRPDGGRSVIYDFEKLPLNAEAKCGVGQYAFDFSLQQIPLVPTTAFVDTVNTGFFSLSHGAGENVILVGARLNPTNPAMGDPVFFGKIVRVQYGQPINMNLDVYDFDRF